MIDDVESLLKDVSFKLGTLNEARKRFAHQLAPDFRIFDYLRTDEMGLSRCIADLLNPRGKHGQGIIFLEAFKDCLEKNMDLSFSWMDKLDKCQVMTEQQTDGSKRRIDIYLKFPNGTIGIENKPWAMDQKDQLSDYAKHLDGRYDNWLLIYLSNRDSLEYSISQKERSKYEADGKLYCCSYAEHIEWLQICAYKAQAPVVRVFIEELIKFIRMNINGELEMSEAIELKASILKSTENLQASFKIVNAMDGVKIDLLNELEHQLREKLQDLSRLLGADLLLRWSPNLKKVPFGAYGGFSIVFIENQNKGLRFQFERGSVLGSFFWGIARSTGVKRNNETWQSIKEIMQEKYGARKQSEHWPWYSDDLHAEFDVRNSELRNWSASAKPWEMIQSGEMAEKIVKVVEDVYRLFNEKNAFHLLKSTVDTH